MQIIRKLSSINEQLKNGSVITIGNFDGVHIGHLALINKVKRHAEELNLPSVLILFEPQPFEFFDSKNAPRRIMELHEKLDKLKELHLTHVIVLDFDEKLAQTSPKDFVKDILVNKAHVNKLVVGYDFKFGAKQLGDISLLEELAPIHGFEVLQVEAKETSLGIISSTLLRKLLSSGDLASVSEALGRDYTMAGVIVDIDQGHQLVKIALKISSSILPNIVLNLTIISSGGLSYGIGQLKNEDENGANANSLDVYFLEQNGYQMGEMVKIQIHNQMPGYQTIDIDSDHEKITKHLQESKKKSL